MKKIVLISSFCNTEEKISILEKNIITIKDLGIDVMLISPIILPEKIQKKCDYFFLTKDNPVLSWPQKSMYFWKTVEINNKKFRITRTLDDYGWAGLYQVKKTSEIALSFDYDYFYHIIYDLKFDQTVINSLLTESDCDVYSSKRNETIWEVGLHLMVFSRKKLTEFINHINLESYLQSDEIIDSFVWLHRLKDKFDYNIVRTPVEDEIYYYDGDQFNYSQIPELKFFVEKNDMKDNTLKLLFYDIEKPKKILIEIEKDRYNIEVNNNLLFDLNMKKDNIKNVLLKLDDVTYDITETLKKVRHNTIEDLD